MVKDDFTTCERYFSEDWAALWRERACTSKGSLRFQS